MAARERGAVLEGRNAVIEALRAGMPLRRILLAENLKADKGIAEIERRAAEVGVELEHRPRRDLDARSEHGAHQGVIAEAEPFRYTPLSKVLERTEGAPRSLIIALDHVTDPGNLGAIVRSAEVAGADAVLVAERRAAAVTPSAYKASAGALAHLPLVQETNLVRALGQLKENGYWVAGADGAARDLAWDAPLEGRLVIVVGSEGEGLARLTRESCDFLVRLPQSGNVGSLNVAQAATVLAYEWVRRGSEG